MRRLEFKMERSGLLEVGQKITVTEGELPSNYYYTIDLTTGKMLSLEDLFREDTEYVQVLASCIEKQLRQEYGYQLDDFLRDELVRQLKEEASFYVNEAGNIVICFDEGDIGPMSLGDLEIIIDNDAVKEIRK